MASTTARTTVASLSFRIDQLEIALKLIEALNNHANAEQPKPVAQQLSPSLRRTIIVMVTLGTSVHDWNIARAVAKERALASNRFGYRIERAPDRDALRVVAIAKAA